MVLATHVIFTAYGFWLPNDPRGSWSTWIRRWELERFGGIVRAGGRASVAWRAHDAARRVAAKGALMYPAVTFDGVQGRAIGRGFARVVEEGGYRVLACAVLPEHVHMVIGRHRRMAQRIVGHMKAAANRRMVEEGVHPFQEVYQPGGDRVSPWTRGAWKVFLDRAEDVERAVAYVEGNPGKEGLPAQRWGFVVGDVSAKADR